MTAHSNFFGETRRAVACLGRLRHFLIHVSLLLLLAVGVSLSGCSRKEAVAEKRGKNPGGAPVPVLVGKAMAKSMPVQIQAIGNVMPYSRVAVRSQITGQLVQVHFQEGKEVRKDDLLFTIDPRPSQAALDQAKANLARDEAQLENAQIEFARAKKLFESNISSRDDYDKAQANLDTLRGTVLADRAAITNARSEEHTSELQSQSNLVCRLLLEKKKKNDIMCPQETQTWIYITRHENMQG